MGCVAQNVARKKTREEKSEEMKGELPAFRSIAMWKWNAYTLFRTAHMS